MLQCHYTRARIPAFINQELPLQTRRYVGRHLDRCPACRAKYEQQKTVKQELVRALPRFGQPDNLALERIWNHIQAELKPEPPPKRAPISFKSYSMGGLVAGLLLILLLPLAGSAGSMAVPNHPSPQTLALTETPTNRVADAAPTRIAIMAQTAPSKTDAPNILDNTPATPAAAVP